MLYQNEQQLTPNTIKYFWKKSSHRVQETNHWNNTESTTQAYTAKAAYKFINNNGTLQTTGQCVDVHSKNTIISKCCSQKISNMLYKFKNPHAALFIEFINTFFMFFAISILFGYINITYSYFIGGIWMLYPITTLLLSNTQIMERIWLKSFLPWLQMYVSICETFGFCDLCGWNRRICILGPPYLLSQFTIINSDCVFLKTSERWRITTQIITSMVFKVFILFSVRMGYVENIYPRNFFLLTFKPNKFYLHNASLFMSKSVSMLCLLFGQLIFRFKHKNKVYSLRTHYTLKPNKEWNELNRKFRVKKKKSLTIDVKNTRNFLHVFDVSKNICV